jgi:membrane-bound serine protease (ClpP class)
MPIHFPVSIQLRRISFAVLALLAFSSAGSAEIPVIELTGVVHAVSAEHVIASLSQAEAAGSPIVILRIDTPGGLLTATYQINEKILSSRVPVVAFVGPAGAHATSAGFIIAMTADVVAMAPGTNMGAAHPVGGMGQADETMAKKAASEVSAYVRSKAAQRGRNVEMAEKAIVDSKSFTDGEALKANLIDLLASDVPDLIGKLDGRTIKRFDGREVKLDLKGQAPAVKEMSWRQAVLSAIARPEILFLLLLGALAGLGTEISHPGLIFPGFIGAVCLILFLFATQIIPINWAGVLFILLAIGLFVAEVKVTSYGLLTVGGITSLILGAMMLIDVPGLRVPLGTVIPAAAVTAAWAILIVRMVLRAQRSKVTTGAEGLLGEQGVVETALSPEGWIRVHGERWRAESEGTVEAGQKVVVTAVHGLRLRVRKENE